MCVLYIYTHIYIFIFYHLTIALHIAHILSMTTMAQLISYI